MEFVEYLRFPAALAFVLALFGAGIFAMRRLGFATGTPMGLFDDRRLCLVESLSLDGRRRLLLVRRDDREHLILLGTAGETLIEAIDEAETVQDFAGVTVYASRQTASGSGSGADPLSAPGPARPH